MRKPTASVRGVLLLLLLLVPALTIATLAAGGKQETKTVAIQMTGQLTFLDVTKGFPMVLVDEGVASHLGQFYDVGKYTSPGSGFGVYYLANGEQLYWRQGAGQFIEFAGGTGRFKNATGSFTFTMSDMQYLPGPEGTTSFVARYTGEGTLTY